MKTVFQCKITTNDGREFFNPLLPFEFNILKTMLKENKSVIVTREQWTEEEVNRTFNIN